MAKAGNDPYSTAIIDKRNHLWLPKSTKLENILLSYFTRGVTVLL